MTKKRILNTDELKRLVKSVDSDWEVGLSIEDRQVLLAQASSSVNKIYTHPNFDLASQYVNRVKPYSTKRSQNVAD